MGYIDWFNHRRLHGEISDENACVIGERIIATGFDDWLARRTP